MDRWEENAQVQLEKELPKLRAEYIALQLQMPKGADGEEEGA